MGTPVTAGVEYYRKVDGVSKAVKELSFKAAHLIPRFERGGAEGTIVTQIAGMEFRGLICCDGGEGVYDLDKRGIPWFQVPFFPSTPANLVSSFITLRQVVLQQSVELIHGHHRFTSLVGRMVALSLHMPFVCTVHGFFDGHRLASRISRGHTIIVHSQAIKLDLIERLGIKPQSIHLIPMGIMPVLEPTVAQRIDLRQQTGCSLETPLVVFAGRLVYEKGPELFLQAVPQVLRRFPDARFWVVGDGELRLELESLAGSLGIDRAVTFWRWRDDINLLLGCADLVVVPSRREGFGKVALQALMLGKPVVAAQVGGLSELVQHEHNGLLIPSGQPAAIVEATIRLIGNRDELTQMGVRAREVRGRFTQEAMCRETEAIYKAAMVRLQRKRS